MGKSYKYIMNHKCLRDFLLQTNKLEDIKSVKYKTLERTTEYVHHYGWSNLHLYSIGIYQLNNGSKISFDYCYEMDREYPQNIKKVIYCKLSMILP